MIGSPRGGDHPARHPGDLVRLATGALTLASAALAARARRPRLGRDLAVSGLLA